MQRLLFVLYQIDEARRQIEAGRLEQLRIALLLLDNAAELQFDRRVREEMVIDEWNENTRSLALLIPEGERPELLRDLVAWIPLTQREKRSLNRTYDKKLEFLSHRRSLIDPRLAGVLAYLHRYRNEAYHEGRVREATLRTACLILLEANCQLLETLSYSTRFASDEDYGWFTERFGMKRAPLVTSGAFAARALRADVSADPLAVAESLAEHLSSRLDELWENLDFIVDGSRLATREAAYTAAQLLAAVKQGRASPELLVEQYTAEMTLDDVAAIVPLIDGVRMSAAPLDAFMVFSELETRLEVIEAPIDGLVEMIDRHVQQHVDLALGK